MFIHIGTETQEDGNISVGMFQSKSEFDCFSKFEMFIQATTETNKHTRINTLKNLYIAF